MNKRIGRMSREECRVGRVAVPLSHATLAPPRLLAHGEVEKSLLIAWEITAAVTLLNTRNIIPSLIESQLETT